jgi:hypothetical protein
MVASCRAKVFLIDYFIANRTVEASIIKSILKTEHCYSSIIDKDGGL